MFRPADRCSDLLLLPGYPVWEQESRLWAPEERSRRRFHSRSEWSRYRRSHSRPGWPPRRRFRFHPEWSLRRPLYFHPELLPCYLLPVRPPQAHPPWALPLLALPRLHPHWELPPGLRCPERLQPAPSGCRLRERLRRSRCPLQPVRSGGSRKRWARRCPQARLLLPAQRYRLPVLPLPQVRPLRPVLRYRLPAQPPDPLRPLPERSPPDCRRPASGPRHQVLQRLPAAPGRRSRHRLHSDPVRQRFLYQSHPVPRRRLPGSPRESYFHWSDWSYWNLCFLYLRWKKSLRLHPASADPG